MMNASVEISAELISRTRSKLMELSQRENELRHACLHNRVDTIRRLSKLNVNIEAEDAHSTTPLMLACYYGHHEVVDELLSNPHVRIDHANIHGLQPLHLACEQQHLSIVQLLLDNEADIHCQTHNGWTPLHFAAESDDFELIKMLLLCGANKSIRDHYGQSPMDIATRHKTTEILRLFEATSDSDLENVDVEQSSKSLNHRHDRSSHSTDDYTVELERERIMRGEISSLKLKLHELRHENGSKMDKLLERIDMVEDNVKSILLTSRTSKLVNRTGSYSPPLNIPKIGVPKTSRFGRSRVGRLKKPKISIRSANQLDLNDTDLDSVTNGRSSLAPSHITNDITINLSTDYGYSEFGDDSEYNKTGHITLRPEAHSLELGGESDLEQLKKLSALSPTSTRDSGTHYLIGYRGALKTSTVHTPMTATSQHQMSPIREEDYPHGHQFDLGLSSVENTPRHSKRNPMSNMSNMKKSIETTKDNDSAVTSNISSLPRTGTKMAHKYKSQPTGAGGLSPPSTVGMSDVQTYEYNRYTSKSNKNRKPRRKLFDIENHQRSGQRSQYDAEAEESDDSAAEEEHHHLNMSLFPDTADMAALKGPRRSQLPHIRDESSIPYPAIDVALRDRTSFKTATTDLTDTELLITDEEYLKFVNFGRDKVGGPNKQPQSGDINQSERRGTHQHNGSSNSKFGMNLSIPSRSGGGGQRNDRNDRNKMSAIPDTIGMMGGDDTQHFQPFQGFSEFGARGNGVNGLSNHSPPESMASRSGKRSVSPSLEKRGAADLRNPQSAATTTHSRSKSTKRRTLFTKGASPGVPFNKTNVKVAVSTLASTAAAAVANSGSAGYNLGTSPKGTSNNNSSGTTGVSLSPNVNWSKRPTQKLYNNHSKKPSEPAQIYANLRSRQRKGSIQSGSSGKSGKSAGKSGANKKLSPSMSTARKKKNKTFSTGLNGVYTVNY